MITHLIVSDDTRDSVHYGLLAPLHPLLTAALRDFRENDGLLCVDTELDLFANGFDVEAVTQWCLHVA